jgi:hypothetical protein
VVLYLLHHIVSDGTEGGALAFSVADGVDGSMDEAVRIIKDGNVGIGTTGPSTPFHVLTDDAGANVDLITFDRTSDSPADADSYDIIVSDGTEGGALAFSVADGVDGSMDEAVRIIKDGNVGIGTTGPAYELDVTGDIRASGSFVGGTGLTPGGNITMADDEWIGVSASDERIIFDTAGDIEIMGADVGIGTTAPAAKLHIAEGNILLDRGSGAAGQTRDLTIGGYRISAGVNYATLTFQNYDTVEYSGAQIASQNEDGSDDGDLRFLTNDGTLTQQMIITSTGNLGIGTTGPSTPFHVLTDDAGANVNLITFATTSSSTTKTTTASRKTSRKLQQSPPT